MYAIIKDKRVLKKALALARGSYQRNILLGHESLSGATLRGKARDYSGRYKDSARSIMKRCQAAGLPVYEVVAEHNKRVVVIGGAA